MISKEEHQTQGIGYLTLCIIMSGLAIYERNSLKNNLSLPLEITIIFLSITFLIGAIYHSRKYVKAKYDEQKS